MITAGNQNRNVPFHACSTKRRRAGGTKQNWVNIQDCELRGRCQMRRFDAESNLESNPSPVAASAYGGFLTYTTEATTV